MPRYVRGTYLLVVKIKTKTIKELIEWPIPDTLTKNVEDRAKEQILKKHKEYIQKYSLNDCDVMLAVSDGLDDLKVSFPELSGWDTAVKTTEVIK